MRLAALDFGSNTTGYLLGEVEGDVLRPGERVSRFVRLGGDSAADDARAAGAFERRQLAEARVFERPLDDLRAADQDGIRVEGVLRRDLAAAVQQGEALLCDPERHQGPGGMRRHRLRLGGRA